VDEGACEFVEYESLVRCALAGGGWAGCEVAYVAGCWGG